MPSRRQKTNSPLLTYVVLGLVVIIGLGWLVYSNIAKEVEINRMATSQARESVLGNWKFDSAKDFGTSGAWIGNNRGSTVLKSSLVTWTNPATGAYMSTRNFQLGMQKKDSSPDNSYRIRSETVDYVVKVKAEARETVLRGPSFTQEDPEQKPAPREFTMKVELLKKSGVLATQTAKGTLNSGQAEYAFVFDAGVVTEPVTGLRFYPNQVGNPVEITVADTKGHKFPVQRNRVKARLIVAVDEISIIGHTLTIEPSPRPRPTSVSMEGTVEKLEKAYFFDATDGYRYVLSGSGQGSPLRYVGKRVIIEGTLTGKTIRTRKIVQVPQSSPGPVSTPTPTPSP